MNTAKKMADYFIQHLPNDFIPYWDLDLPQGNTKLYHDASAAAIELSGLLELSNFAEANSKYKLAAEKILSSFINSYQSEQIHMGFSFTVLTT